MKGKICIVTGSNSGIGKETTLALADMGATIIMAVRSKERGENARKEIVGKTGNTAISLMICDLASMDSIRQFVKEFNDSYSKLDVLINNAGAVFTQRETTVDGFERTLAVNYLGPFLLTYEMISLLKSSTPSRIINLSSGLSKSAELNLDSFQNEKKYNGMKAYGKAKLMIIMFTYELAYRLEGTAVTVNAVHPGFVATNLGRNTGSFLSSLGFRMMRPFQISAKKGAETSVYLASSDNVKDVTGKCFSKLREITTAPISYDKQNQKLLWDKTIKLLMLDPF